MKHILMSVALAALVSTSLSAGESREGEPTLSPPKAAEATNALTLEGALEKVSELNPELLSLKYESTAAQARVDQAGMSPNPTLGMTLEDFGGIDRVKGVRDMEATVLGTQLFERGGKRERRIELAGREREVTEKSTAVRRSELKAAVAAAYLRAVADRERLALADEPLRLARETLDAVQKRVAAAVASPAESARAKAAVASAQVEYNRAKAAVANSDTALAALWANASEQALDPKGRLSLPEKPPSKDKFLSKIADNPRFDLQNSMVEARRAALSLEHSRGVADVTVGAGVRYYSGGSDFGFVLNASIPIMFRDDNSGNIAAAREQLGGAEQYGQAVEIEVRSAFTAAWRDLEAAHATALGLKLDALPATREALSAVRAAYAKGTLPLIDVLDAQRAEASVKREILDAEYAYATALVRVESLTDPSFAAVCELLKQP